MVGKINVCPIVRGHIRTLTSGEANATRVLFSDLLLFYLLPVAAAGALVYANVVIPSGFVDFLVITFSIFIPLLANVLFSIFSIQDKPAAQATPEARKLLHDIYLNLSYAIVVAFAAVTALGVTKLIGQPRLFVGTEAFWDWFNPIATRVVWGFAFFLTFHMVLTLLMIVKRTHSLLGHAYLPTKP